MFSFEKNRRLSRSRRRGAALLICLFVIFMTVMLVVQVLDTMTLDLAALRNSLDYERALYLANAGVHEVASEVEADTTWRGTITDGAYPNDDTYSATAVDGAEINTVTVTSSGVSGDITRAVTAIIEL